MTYEFPSIKDPDREDKGSIFKLDLGEASSFVNASFPLLTL
jgi:hypothetical protein